MNRSTCRSVARKVALAGLAAIPMAAAAQAQTIPSAFTYQGRLTDAGATPTSPYDFQFRLFDAASAGTQIGSTVVLNDVPVSSGLFTARLDFGDQFDGSPRWLQIEARPGASTGIYTTLSPRNELTAAPYALGPWQVVTGSTYPNNGVFLRSGNGSYFGMDSVNGDLHANGGSDGHFGIFSDGAATGSMVLATGNTARLRILNNTGNIGIGTDSPAFKLHINGAPADQFPFVVQSHSTLGGNAIRGVIEANASGNFSSGVTGVNVAPAGPSGGFGMYAEHTNGGTGIRAIGHGNGRGVEGIAQGFNGLAGYFVNTAPGGTAVWVDGLCMVKTLQILGGSDLAEPFDVAAAGDAKAEPGMLVVIDPANPGALKLATEPYDTRIAGAISGANGLAPGMVMAAKGVEKADGEHPVAMTGRVWVWCDAAFGAITPGDRLTSSSTTGHAMKASDSARAGGAVIGKAMTELKDGRGMVLVLVNLQ